MSNSRIIKSLWLFFFFAVSQRGVTAADFDFHTPATASDAETPAIMRDLAARLIPVYQESDPDRYLANLSALQMVAGDYGAADVSRQTLRDRRRRADLGRPAGRALIYDLYAHARALEAQNPTTFADGFTKSFRELISRLDNQDAYAVTRSLQASPQDVPDAFQRLLDQQRNKDSIDPSNAVELIWAYVDFDAYRSFGSLVDSLIVEDDDRRYSVDNNVVVRTSDGPGIVAMIIRPKSPTGPLPTLLEFTILDSQNEAKECAAHGYIGVVASNRGPRNGSHVVAPFEHDGDDARAVINWIAKQSWSDGRVGMYGVGYSGFTPWAALKHQPRALKAIATSAAIAPGINVPMLGNIFHNSAYRWSLRVTDPTATGAGGVHDDETGYSLDQKWFRSGSRYRDLGRVSGKPNPIFIRWLNHPSYDRYWQKMIPFRDQFARVNIPVLTMTGYYAASEPADLYYFTQHHRYNPHADHILLIGPYDDGLMQSGPTTTLHGVSLDPAALADFRELRYQWFDHIFKGGTSPTLLKDVVNYQVMGTNEWRHAASLDATAKESLRFYLDAGAAGAGHRLARHKTPPKANRKKTKLTFVQQIVSLVDRNDAGGIPTGLLGKSLATHQGTMFVSDPLPEPTEFNGLYSGRLDFTVNKMDMDVNITLYERLAGGDYIRLFSTVDEFRASYVQDRVHRHLLKAGERQELTFKSERMTSRRLQAGSRLVMVIGIGMRPDREINYGTGEDVSEESIADGKIPMKIRWYSDSYIDIPIRK